MRDRRPQARVRRQALIVTEDTQRPRSVPGLCESLQTALERDRDLAVRSPVVRDERVEGVPARVRSLSLPDYGAGVV
jgi:hypothetical protein